MLSLYSNRKVTKIGNNAKGNCFYATEALSIFFNKANVPSVKFYQSS